MKTLTAEQLRALEPVGLPGEYASGETLDFLVREGYATWAIDPDNPTGPRVFMPTELGLIALRLHHSR